MSGFEKFRGLNIRFCSLGGDVSNPNSLGGYIYFFLSRRSDRGEQTGRDERRRKETRCARVAPAAPAGGGSRPMRGFSDRARARVASRGVGWEAVAPGTDCAEGEGGVYSFHCFVRFAVDTS